MMSSRSNRPRHPSLSASLPTQGLVAAATVGGLLVSGAATHASTIAEIEANNTIATAQAIGSSSFTLPVPSTIFNPPGYVTATVTGGAANGDVDFFAFSTSALGLAYFDIDNDPNVGDAILTLFDSTGTVLAIDDDSFPADPGSAFGGDPFLGVIALPAGTYYVAVSAFNNSPLGAAAPEFHALMRPDGHFGGYRLVGATPGDGSFLGGGGSVDYTLHLSVEQAAPVPEPTSLSLLGIGIAGLIFCRSRRRPS